MAYPRSHIPPIFETSSSLPIVYPSTDFKLSPKLPCRPYFTRTQLLSVVLLLVLAIQVFKSPTTIFEVPSERAYIRHGALKAPALICREEDLFTTPLPVSRPHKMALLKEAKSVAEQFDYPPEELNKGVKAFIQQMGRLSLDAGESRAILNTLP